jgi:hypothetical protein
MIEAIEHADCRQIVDFGRLDVALVASEHLRPSLRGIVAEHVAELFENPERILDTAKSPSSTGSGRAEQADTSVQPQRRRPVGPFCGRT